MDQVEEMDQCQRQESTMAMVWFIMIKKFCFGSRACCLSSLTFAGAARAAHAQNRERYCFSSFLLYLRKFRTNGATCHFEFCLSSIQ